MNERQLRDISDPPVDIIDEIGAPFWQDMKGRWT